MAYQLELPHQWSIHPVFHVSLLTPYIETDAHGPNFSQPPPDLTKGEGEYEVEAIRNHQCFGKNKRLQYLLKWKGHPESNNTWEPVEQLHAPDLVKQYYKHHPLDKIKSVLLTRLKSHLPSWLPPLSPTIPSLLTTQTPSRTPQSSPLIISHASFNPPLSDNLPLPFVYPSPKKPTHHCDRWWTPIHVFTPFTSSSLVPGRTTHTLMPLRAGSSAANVGIANTILATRSPWTAPNPSSMPTTLYSLMMGPPTHTTPIFPSLCLTTPSMHPMSHPHPPCCAHPHSPFLSVLPRMQFTLSLAFPHSHLKQHLQYWQPRRTLMMPSMPSPLASSPLSTTARASMDSPLRSSLGTTMSSITRSANSPLTSRTKGTTSRCQKVLNQMQAMSRPKFLLAMAIEMPSGSDVVTMDESSCWLGRALMRSPSPLIYISHQTMHQMSPALRTPGGYRSLRLM